MVVWCGERTYPPKLQNTHIYLTLNPREFMASTRILSDEADVPQHQEDRDDVRRVADAWEGPGGWHREESPTIIVISCVLKVPGLRTLKDAGLRLVRVCRT